MLWNKGQQLQNQLCRRDAHGLARALQKIEAYARQQPNLAAERNPATAHLFIINPLAGRGRDNLFYTHPATQNRVEALMRMTGRDAPRAAAVPVTAGRRPGPWG